MPDFEITQIAYVLVTMLVAWLGWPVANRIRSLAMIDAAREIAMLKEKLSKQASVLTELQFRVTLIEDRKK